MTYDDVEEKVRKALLGVLEAAAEFSPLFATGEHERTYRIARKLCEAEGYNPDGISMGNAGAPAMLDAKKAIVLVLPIRPNWMLYWHDAKAAIEVVEDTP
jgi:hypothetical protein